MAIKYGQRAIYLTDLTLLTYLVSRSRDIYSIVLIPFLIITLYLRITSLLPRNLHVVILVVVGLLLLS